MKLNSLIRLKSCSAFYPIRYINFRLIFIIAFRYRGKKILLLYHGNRFVTTYIDITMQEFKYHRFKLKLNWHKYDFVFECRILIHFPNNVIDWNFLRSTSDRTQHNIHPVCCIFFSLSIRMTTIELFANNKWNWNKWNVQSIQHAIRWTINNKDQSQCAEPNWTKTYNCYYCCCCHVSMASTKKRRNFTRKCNLCCLQMLCLGFVPMLRIGEKNAINNMTIDDWA